MLAGIIQEYQKAAVIVVNKWDIVEKDKQPNHESHRR